MLLALSLSRLLACGRERKRPVSYSRGGAARGVAVSAQRRETQVRFLAQAPKFLPEYCLLRVLFVPI